MDYDFQNNLYFKDMQVLRTEHFAIENRFPYFGIYRIIGKDENISLEYLTQIRLEKVAYKKINVNKVTEHGHFETYEIDIPYVVFMPATSLIPYMSEIEETLNQYLLRQTLPQHYAAIYSSEDLEQNDSIKR